ncbi:MAG: DNA-binding response regulator, partial [Actinomycetota bacterium]
MSSTTPLRVSIVNDYEIVVEGLRAMLAPYSDRVEVVETEVGGLPGDLADVVLFDTFAGRRHAIERVNLLSEDPRRSRLVLYTWDAPPGFIDDIDRQRVDAVIPKRLSGESLVSALEQVVTGQSVSVDLLADDVPP